MQYCGCCGETYQDCRCPAGPTQSFSECKRRWDTRECADVHLLEVPTGYLPQLDDSQLERP